ncbi:MAG: DEAD/DEAH box helicase [Ignavibacteriales bacterium]
MPEEFLKRYWAEHGWELVFSTTRPSRSRGLFPIDTLPVSTSTRRYLLDGYPRGLYGHQLSAIRLSCEGHDVALATSTASGKSLVFYASAIENLTRQPDSAVLAVYPLKALGREQHQRWCSALSSAGIDASAVVRIDGDIPVAQRQSALRGAKVVVATPDIIHAWLLPNIGDSAVWSFIRRIGLVVVDEVHVYAGVFGSNAAFVFRRLEHQLALAGRRAAYITASATIRGPVEHLRALFGREFNVIEQAQDTSGHQAVRIFMVRPPENKDLLSSLAACLQGIVRETEAKFIVFMDSRKQTELVSAIVARSQEYVPDDTGTEFADLDHLNRLDVLPYRAGFEEGDRAVIQERLSRGKLRGVVSTSALELGIDIPHLDIGVLVGVPRSKTTLEQRMGRVGRQQPGTVVLINNRDLYSEAMFRNPLDVLERPLAEGALYLENSRIQYIHAMCLARSGGEHDQGWARSGAASEEPFNTAVDWPSGFVELCERERSGELPPDLQTMKMEAGDTPHHVYPLRDVESQFAVEQRQGPHQARLGSLSYSQVLREAYPGAVYYYTAIPYRVYQVSQRSRTIRVRRERYYTTRPIMFPTQVFPNLTPGNIYRAVRHSSLLLVECSLQIRETVCGFKERRGSTELTQHYPLEAGIGVSHPQPVFSRNYFTTGVIIADPTLASQGVNLDALGHLLYECFLMEIPFERQDISWGWGKLKVTRGVLSEGTRFVAIYDQTYGSLRLTGRLLDEGVAGRVIAKASELASEESLFEIGPETRECLLSLQLSANSSAEIDSALGKEIGVTDEQGEGDRVRVVMPGSMGLNQSVGNEEFIVEAVFFSPRDGDLRYRGHYLTDRDPSVKTTIPVNHLLAIPGESRLAWYYVDSGEMKPCE